MATTLDGAIRLTVAGGVVVASLVLGGKRGVALWEQIQAELADR